MKKNQQNLNKIFTSIEKSTFNSSDKEDLKNIIKEYYPRMGDISLLAFADRVFSDYIKIKKSDSDGVCTCITCGVRGERNNKDMQNGHFKSRSCRKYRFSEENCRPQCKICNVIKNGNYGEYMLAMQRGLGAKRAEEIWKDRQIVKLYEYDLLLCILSSYRCIQKEKDKRGIF